MLWFLATGAIVLLYVVSVSQGAGLVGWPRDTSGYNYNEPDAWGYGHPACNGYRQSPIDLNPDHFRYVADGSPLRWKGYEITPESMTITNSGHSLELSGQWPDNRRPFITGGPLDGEYVFAQLHFHWGENDTVGSEHTAGGTRYPLEMHMVHWKREYQSFERALQFPDGLSVVGLLYEISEDTGLTTPLNMIFDHTNDVREAGTTTNVQPFPLTILDVVDAKISFMTYLGSLTTPPCYEVVIWIIPNFIATVSTSQMQKLRSLQLNHGDQRNYRPLQRRNDRLIYFFLNS